MCEVCDDCLVNVVIGELAAQCVSRWWGVNVPYKFATACGVTTRVQCNGQQTVTVEMAARAQRARQKHVLGRQMREIFTESRACAPKARNFGAGANARNFWTVQIHTTHPWYVHACSRRARTSPPAPPAWPDKDESQSNIHTYTRAQPARPASRTT